jgi:AraC-like DNA-binding protein
MTVAADSQETIAFQRRADFPGVEVRTVESSSTAWRSYSAEFEFLSPHSWRGEVWHRQRRHPLEMGLVLCAEPGEVYRATQVHTPGTRSCLVIDGHVLGDYVEEQGIPREHLHLRAIAPLSEPLRSRLFQLHRALQPGKTLLEAQSCMVSFVAALVKGLRERGTAPRADLPWSNWSSLAAARARGYLHDQTSQPVDLTALARQVGLSRFQALRAFKRHYGLPPHAYQLRVRVGLAQRSLRAGEQPAQVAADCGFVDQSHMTRHFKRLVGVTPAQYQRVGAGAH